MLEDSCVPAEVITMQSLTTRHSSLCEQKS